MRQRLYGDDLPEELAGALLRAVASYQAFATALSFEGRLIG